MKILLLVIVALFPNILFAKQVDTLLVKNIAINTMQSLSPKRGVYEIDYLKTYKVNNIPTFYLVKFNKTGFVIVSANDATIPILAYSISSNTGIENVSPSYQDFIDYFNESIDYANKNNLPNIKTKEHWNNILNKNNKSITSVSPLLIETKWGQRSSNDGFCKAYNYYVPEVDIDCICSDGENTATTSPTGCVATAMGQIMYYWKFPVYTSNRTYNWCIMPHELSKVNNSNYEQQRNQVARLLADCGSEVNMDYSDGDNDGECSAGAYTSSARSAYVNHFHYSDDADYKNRWWYEFWWSEGDWKQLIKDDLDNGRPVHYKGKGHSFICDGYGYNGSNDYFHFNFGWYGMYSDPSTYFTINTLTPGSHNYNSSQGAIFELHPGSGGSYADCIDCNENITISNVVIANNPYSSDYPYIEWSGLPMQYNYMWPYSTLLHRPLASEIITEYGETRLEYFDITAGTIHADNVVIPDNVNVHLKAYDEIILTNFSTEDGAEFTAEIIPCPNENKSMGLGGNDTDNREVKQTEELERVFDISPNPCSYEANIKYSVKDNENFEISVVNIFGQVELSLIKGKQSKGVYNLTFNTNSLKNGIYICILQTDDEIKTIKFIKTSELK